MTQEEQAVLAAAQAYVRARERRVEAAVAVRTAPRNEAGRGLVGAFNTACAGTAEALERLAEAATAAYSTSCPETPS